jgi:hypothetical protein
VACPAERRAERLIALETLPALAVFAAQKLSVEIDKLKNIGTLSTDGFVEFVAQKLLCRVVPTDDLVVTVD